MKNQDVSESYLRSLEPHIQESDLWVMEQVRFSYHDEDDSYTLTCF